MFYTKIPLLLCQACIYEHNLTVLDVCIIEFALFTLQNLQDVVFELGETGVIVTGQKSNEVSGLGVW